MVESTLPTDRLRAAAPLEADGEVSVRPDLPQGAELVYDDLARIGREFHARGWVLGTSGNFSALISRAPTRIAITATGVDKGSLSPADIVLVDGQGNKLAGSGSPSAELMLHVALIRKTGAGAVLHTHSVWATVLSDRAGPGGAIEFAGQEMLKALPGVSTHLHRERLPVIENSQDVEVLCARAEDALARQLVSHGLLICRHGLYGWGADLAAAKAAVESLEFLLEVTGRSDRTLQRRFVQPGGRGEEFMPWHC